MLRNSVKRLLLPLLALVILLAPATTLAGGWVVVTVGDLPRTVSAGEPVALTFAVRQHGHHLIDLDGATVTATQVESGERLHFPVEPTGVEGYHRAVLTFPQAGVWEWQFEPTPFPTVAVFAPLTVLPAAPQTDATPSHWLTGWLQILLKSPANVRTSAASAEAVDDAAYGRALFLAKGCAACHRHDEADLGWTLEAGPNLTEYRPDPHYVRSFLRNAAVLTADRQWPMPTLELSDAEIDALLAFLGDGEIAQAQ